MGWKLMGLLAVLVGLLPSCSMGDPQPYRAYLGGLMIERLHVGMTRAEVDAAIGDLKPFAWKDSAEAIQSERDLFRLYAGSFYPKDVLKTVQVGTTSRMFSYYTNRGQSGTGALRIFFDDETQRLRGWVNNDSWQSVDRYMHERLTSQLKTSEGGSEKGMSHAKVRALIGEPHEIVSLSAESRAIYENHFWLNIPSFSKKQKIEVYTYPLSNGEKRRVYLVYYPAADELESWGYDHAWEEAERYQREQQDSKKK